MPDSVPLFGPCRLLPILGKNPLRGKPIRVFFTSKLAVCISAASFFLFLSPVRHSIHCFRQEDLALFSFARSSCASLRTPTISLMLPRFCLVLSACGPFSPGATLLRVSYVTHCLCLDEIDIVGLLSSR